MSSKSVTDEEYAVLAEFRYSLRKFLHFSSKEAEKVHLTPKQHQCLLALRGFSTEERRVNVGDLAEWLQIKHHSAVGLINRMEEQGLIIRDQSKSDKRKVFIELSPKGRDLLEELTAVHKEEIKRIGPQLKELLHLITDRD